MEKVITGISFFFFFFLLFFSFSISQTRVDKGSHLRDSSVEPLAEQIVVGKLSVIVSAKKKKKKEKKMLCV